MAEPPAPHSPPLMSALEGAVIWNDAPRYVRLFARLLVGCPSHGTLPDRWVDLRDVAGVELRSDPSRGLMVCLQMVSSQTVSLRCGSNTQVWYTALEGRLRSLHGDAAEAVPHFRPNMDALNRLPTAEGGDAVVRLNAVLDRHTGCAQDLLATHRKAYLQELQNPIHNPSLLTHPLIQREAADEGASATLRGDSRVPQSQDPALAHALQSASIDAANYVHLMRTVSSAVWAACSAPPEPIRTLLLHTAVPAPLPSPGPAHGLSVSQPSPSGAPGPPHQSPRISAFRAVNQPPAAITTPIPTASPMSLARARFQSELLEPSGTPERPPRHATANSPPIAVPVPAARPDPLPTPPSPSPDSRSLASSVGPVFLIDEGPSTVSTPSPAPSPARVPALQWLQPVHMAKQHQVLPPRTHSTRRPPPLPSSFPAFVDTVLAPRTSNPHPRSSPLSAHPTAHRRLCAEDPAPLLI